MYLGYIGIFFKNLKTQTCGDRNYSLSQTFCLNLRFVLKGREKKSKNIVLKITNRGSLLLNNTSYDSENSISLIQTTDNLRLSAMLPKQKRNVNKSYFAFDLDNKYFTNAEP